MKSDRSRLIEEINLMKQSHPQLMTPALERELLSTIKEDEAQKLKLAIKSTLNLQTKE